MKKEPTAREKANGRPCVVIEYAEHGGFFVHADPEVQVFNRHEDPDIEGLYQYENLPIPEDWLNEPAISLGGVQYA